MAILSSSSLAGPGYIILNVVRAMNIIALNTVVAASMVMLIKTFVVSKFFFFDAVTHVITALTSIFLVVSECSLFKGYFARNWPLLSPAHGFVTLGVAMIIIGLNILGNMNKEATSQESMGLPFWRLVVASGILSLVIGFFNVIVSYVFRDSSRGITARRVRSHGAVALTDQESGITKSLSINTHTTGSSSSGTLRPIELTSPHAPRSPRFSPARTFRNARNSILPSYHSSSPLRVFQSSSSNSTGSSPSKKSKRSSTGPRVPLNISAPLNVNPQFAHLVRPDLAHHPSHRSPSEQTGLGF